MNGTASSLPPEILVSSTDHKVRSLPVLVMFPHNQCQCRCAMCDIWKLRESHEIAPADLDRELNSFRKLGVRWVVFSGGEPQLNRGWFQLARSLKRVGIRVTLLTAGLLLEDEVIQIAQNIDDVIVSLDGPPAVHDSIRRVSNAFSKMAAGVSAIRQVRPEMIIRARCTVQKANHTYLRATVQAAKLARLNSISFLAADLSSEAFNRSLPWSSERQAKVALSPSEIEALEAEIDFLTRNNQFDFDSGFIVENLEKLRRIALHFRAHLGQCLHVAPKCNAPWVSTVIEANGDVRPCFFHPPFGNIHKQPLVQILNGSAAIQFRAHLDIATNPICRRCVCSLHIPANQAQRSLNKSQVRHCDRRTESQKESSTISREREHAAKHNCE